MKKYIYFTFLLYANFSNASWSDCFGCLHYSRVNHDNHTGDVGIRMSADHIPRAVPVLSQITNVEIIRLTFSQTNLYNQYGQIIEPIPVEAQPVRYNPALTAQERLLALSFIANFNQNGVDYDIGNGH